MHQFRLPLALLAFAAAMSGLAACDKSPESTDIPAQRFTSQLNVLGKPAGSVTGQIVYPSEFAQRSTTFQLNDEVFATLPDGRFWVRTIPSGDYLLRVYMTGFEPILRPVRIERAHLADVQRLMLMPARGRVLGRLVYSDGRSAAGVALSLRPYNMAGRTDQDGIFQFYGVGAGVHMLNVDDQRLSPQQREVRLGANEVRNLGNISVIQRTETASGFAGTVEARGGG